MYPPTIIVLLFPEHQLTVTSAEAHQEQERERAAAAKKEKKKKAAASRAVRKLKFRKAGKRARDVKGRFGRYQSYYDTSHSLSMVRPRNTFPNLSPVTPNTSGNHTISLSSPLIILTNASAHRQHNTMP